MMHFERHGTIYKALLVVFIAVLVVAFVKLVWGIHVR
jgi:hypothetical protein